MLASCGGDKEDKGEEKEEGGKSDSTETTKPNNGGDLGNVKAGAGDVQLGGVIHLADDEAYSSLFPMAIEDLISSQVATQIYDGLLKFNPNTLELEGAIAESYEVTDDNKVFTFKLRQGVKFHDNSCFEGGKGRELTAADFKYTFELMCAGDNDLAKSNYEAIFKEDVVGADEYNQGAADEVAGFKVIDDYTFQIELKNPQFSFLYKLAQAPTSVIAKEAYEAYGAEITVGTGPFVFHSKDASGLVLAKNPNYFLKDEAGNQLPYLDSVYFHYVDSKPEQVDMFESGKLTVLRGLPADKVSEIIQEKIDEYQFDGEPPLKMFELKPELASQYYEFNMTRSHFKDVRVRQAFNYAIDRSKVIENALKGQANKNGDYGITPPVKIIKDYPFDSLQNYGYSYDPEKAKALMAEAGYPGGEGFPILMLEINSGGNMHNKVAKEVVKQLESVLGIHVNQEVVPFAKKLEDSKYAKADMFRSAWVADYPDPETFLTNCYGKYVPNSLEEPSHPNTMRYKNADFDKYFEAGLAADNIEERYENFYMAEKIMMEDPPIIPLWYTEDYKLYYSYVRNYSPNALSYLDLSQVFLKHYTKEEYLETH